MSGLRKIQRTQSGSFFVCLPKPWAERHGLKRGSIVKISESSNGKILINPQYDVEPSLRIVTIPLGPYLSREIVGNYLLGFDIITVKTKKHIDFESRETVKTVANRLIGLEIVEENYSTIVLQSLLEPSGFPPEKILRRGYAIASSMHRDVFNALITGNLQLAKSIVARDDEVNRLYFLLVRILRTIIQNPNVSAKLNVRPIDCLDYRLVASLVEAIGDECVQIALKILELNGLTLADDLKQALKLFHAVCFDAQENAIRAFLTKDISVAENVRNLRERIDTTFANIERVARDQSLDVVPEILAIISILKQIYAHSVDIADLVM